MTGLLNHTSLICTSKFAPLKVCRAKIDPSSSPDRIESGIPRIDRSRKVPTYCATNGSAIQVAEQTRKVGRRDLDLLVSSQS